MNGSSLHIRYFCLSLDDISAFAANRCMHSFLIAFLFLPLFEGIVAGDGILVLVRYKNATASTGLINNVSLSNAFPGGEILSMTVVDVATIQTNSTGSDSSSGSNTGIIIGSVVGGVGVVMIIGGIIFFAQSKKAGDGAGPLNPEEQERLLHQRNARYANPDQYQQPSQVPAANSSCMTSRADSGRIIRVDLVRFVPDMVGWAG